LILEEYQRLIVLGFLPARNKPYKYGKAKKK